MKHMTESESMAYLQSKYPNANVFPGVIKGGMNDVMVAQIWDDETEDFITLELVITG